MWVKVDKTQNTCQKEGSKQQLGRTVEYITAIQICCVIWFQNGEKTSY